MNAGMLRKGAVVLSAFALIGLGTVTVACSPRNEKPADSSVTTPEPSPTEKGMRTNVTRSPMSVAPPGGGNGAVPCGFGSAGGLPCSRNN